MGCGCAKRGKALSSAAANIRQGKLGPAAERLGFVGKSIAHDVRRALAKAKMDARKRK